YGHCRRCQTGRTPRARPPTAGDSGTIARRAEDEADGILGSRLALGFTRKFFGFLYASEPVTSGRLRPFMVTSSEANKRGQRWRLGFDVAAGQSALFKILLVIILGLVKRAYRHDLGNDRAAVLA